MSHYIRSSDEERRELMNRRRSGDLTVSNQQIADAFEIDIDRDPYDLPLERLEPSHPTLFQYGKHWRYFERLRAEAPVHYHKHAMAGPYWSVTRFDDIRYVDSNHEIFSSDQSRGGISLNGRKPQELTADSFVNFIATDPPKHDEQRQVVTPMFTPKNLAEIEPLIRERAGRILDNLPINEEFNWVEKVSIELTGQMLATLFDVPQEDRLKLIDWSDTISALGDPEQFDNPEQGWAKLQHCVGYFREFFDERRKQPPKFDLLSMMAHDPATNNQTPGEFFGNIMLLIVGGNDTTRNSISGGVLALNQNPDEYAKLRANHDLIPSMVPEIIRWQSPVLHMARTATRDTELGGQQIREGDRVCMWYVSGNRDDDKLERPNDFIIDRARPREHMSFGFGIHRCVGNRLAEMQLRTIWQEILKRFDTIEVTGEPKRIRSNFIHGIRELPVTIRA